MAPFWLKDLICKLQYPAAAAGEVLSLNLEMWQAAQWPHYLNSSNKLCQQDTDSELCFSKRSHFSDNGVIDCFSHCLTCFEDFFLVNMWCMFLMINVESGDILPISYLFYVNLIWLTNVTVSVVGPTWSMVQKIWASSCWKRRTRVRPVRAPDNSFLCRTPKSAMRMGNSLQERGRWSNIRLSPNKEYEKKKTHKNTNAKCCLELSH